LNDEKAALMEKAEKILRSALLTVAMRAAMGAAYPTWSDEFARKEVRDTWSDTSEQFTLMELARVPEGVLRNYGFSRWSEEDDLMLVPLWAFNRIADGEHLICIDGTNAIKGTDDVDLDVRGGCLAFGFTKHRETV
jgi:hypothetical protein